MRSGFSLILQIAIIYGLCSCRASKPLNSSPGKNLTESAYINNYKDIAVSEMKRTGIPASITLAQGMIESDCGRSTLAREANNHFGIKCHSDWTGPTVRHHDDSRNECFRKYRKPEESFYDHSYFLKSRSRYSFLFDIDPTDYKAWARGLKKAGYATNPDYANMLIRKIEEKSLYNFDSGYKSSNLPQVKQVAEQESPAVQDTNNTMNPVYPLDENRVVAARVPRIMENNRIQYIIVKEGDTREKLGKAFSLLKWELSKYNELESDYPLIPGQMLYLQPKRDKAEPGKEYHNSVEGETMYLISQHYGIKLKSLYEMNRMTEDTEPEPGRKIWLRSIKPVD